MNNNETEFVTHTISGPGPKSAKSADYAKKARYHPEIGVYSFMADILGAPVVADPEADAIEVEMDGAGQLPGVEDPAPEIPLAQKSREQQRLVIGQHLARVSIERAAQEALAVHLKAEEIPGWLDRWVTASQMANKLREKEWRLAAVLVKLREKRPATLTRGTYTVVRESAGRPWMRYGFKSRPHLGGRPVSRRTRAMRATTGTMIAALVFCGLFLVQTISSWPCFQPAFQPMVASSGETPVFLFLNHSQIIADEDGYFQCWANGSVYLIAEIGGPDDAWGGDISEFSFEEVDSDLVGRQDYSCTTGLHSWAYVLPDEMTLCNLSIPEWCRSRFTSLSLQPIYIAQGEVNPTRSTPARIDFNASGSIAILIWSLGNFSDLALSLDGETLIANDYGEDLGHECLAMAQVMFDSEWLRFPARIQAGRHTLDISGQENYTIFYSIMHGTADFDEDLLLDYEEMMSGEPSLSPRWSNLWGYQQNEAGGDNVSIEDIVTGTEGRWVYGEICFYIPDLGKIYPYDPLAEENSEYELRLVSYNGQFENISIDGDNSVLEDVMLVGYCGTDSYPVAICDQDGLEQEVDLASNQIYPSYVTCPLSGAGWHSISFYEFQTPVVLPSLVPFLDGRQVLLIASDEEPSADLDVDDDGVPDGVDSSPFEMLTWRKDTLLQLTVPCDRTSGEDVKIDVDVIRGLEDPDASKEFIWHDGEVGERKVRLTQAMILYGPGDNAPAQGLTDYWESLGDLQIFMNNSQYPWQVDTYDLIDKDAYGEIRSENDTAITGDCDPLPQNGTMAYDYQMLVMPEQTTNVSSYTLWYPSDHPAIQNDGVIVLRVRFVIAVVAEDSNLLGFYDYPGDINISAIVVNFLSDVNGLLGEPRDASENLVLWALNMNPGVATDWGSGFDSEIDRAIVASFAGGHFMTQYHYDDSIPATWGATERLTYARNATPWDSVSAEVTYLTSTKRTLDLLSKINQSVKFDLVTGEQYCVHPQQYDFGSPGDFIFISAPDTPIIPGWVGNGVGSGYIERNVQTRANVVDLYAPLIYGGVSMRLDAGSANNTGTVTFSLYLPSINDKCEIRFGNDTTPDAFALVVEKEAYGDRTWVQYRTPADTLEKICEVWPGEWFSFEVWFDNGSNSYLTPNCSTWDVFMSGAMDYATVGLPSWHPCWNGIQYVDVHVFAGDTVDFDGFGFHAGQFGPDDEYACTSIDSVHYGDQRERTSFYIVSDVYNGTYIPGDSELDGNTWTLWTSEYATYGHYIERAHLNAWPMTIQFRRVNDSLYDGFSMFQCGNISFVEVAGIPASDLPGCAGADYTWVGRDVPITALFQHLLISEWALDIAPQVPYTVNFEQLDQIWWETDWRVGEVDSWEELYTRHSGKEGDIVFNMNQFTPIRKLARFKKWCESLIHDINLGSQNGGLSSISRAYYLPYLGRYYYEPGGVEDATFISTNNNAFNQVMSYVKVTINERTIRDWAQGFIVAFDRLVNLISSPASLSGSVFGWYDWVPRLIEKVGDGPRLNDEQVANLVTCESLLEMEGFHVYPPDVFDDPNAFTGGLTQIKNGQKHEFYFKYVFEVVTRADMLSVLRSFFQATNVWGWWRTIGHHPRTLNLFHAYSRFGGMKPSDFLVGRADEVVGVWDDYVYLPEIPADFHGEDFVTENLYSLSSKGLPLGPTVLPDGGIVDVTFQDYDIITFNPNGNYPEFANGNWYAKYPSTPLDPQRCLWAMTWGGPKYSTTPGFVLLEKIERNLLALSRSGGLDAKWRAKLNDLSALEADFGMGSKSNLRFTSDALKAWNFRDNAMETARESYAHIMYDFIKYTPQVDINYNCYLRPCFDWAEELIDLFPHDYSSAFGSDRRSVTRLATEMRRHRGDTMTWQGRFESADRVFLLFIENVYEIKSAQGPTMDEKTAAIGILVSEAAAEIDARLQYRELIVQWLRFKEDKSGLGTLGWNRGRPHSKYSISGFLAQVAENKIGAKVCGEWGFRRDTSDVGGHAPVETDKWANDEALDVDKNGYRGVVNKDKKRMLYDRDGPGGLPANPAINIGMTWKEYRDAIDLHQQRRIPLPTWLEEIIENAQRLARSAEWDGGRMPSTLSDAGFALGALGPLDYLGRTGMAISFGIFMDLFGGGASSAGLDAGTTLMTSAFSIANLKPIPSGALPPVSLIPGVPVSPYTEGNTGGQYHDFLLAPLGDKVNPFDYHGLNPLFNMPYGKQVIDAEDLSAMWQYEPGVQQIAAETIKNAKMYIDHYDDLVFYDDTYIWGGSGNMYDDIGNAWNIIYDAQIAESVKAQVAQQLERYLRGLKITAFLSAVFCVIGITNLVLDYQNGADLTTLSLDWVGVVALSCNLAVSLMDLVWPVVIPASVWAISSILSVVSTIIGLYLSIISYIGLMFSVGLYHQELIRNFATHYLTMIKMDVSAELGTLSFVRHGGLMAGDTLTTDVVVENTGFLHWHTNEYGTDYWQEDSSGAPFWFHSQIAVGNSLQTWNASSGMAGPWSEGSSWNWVSYPLHSNGSLDPNRGLLRMPDTDHWSRIWNGFYYDDKYYDPLPDTPNGAYPYSMPVTLTAPVTQLAYWMDYEIATTYYGRTNYGIESWVPWRLLGDANDDGYIDLLYETPVTVLEGDLTAFKATCDDVNTTTPLDNLTNMINEAIANYQWFDAANNASALAALAANESTMAQYNQTVGRLQSLAGLNQTWRSYITATEWQNMTYSDYLADNYYLLQTDNASEYEGLLSNQTLLAAGWRAARAMGEADWTIYAANLFEDLPDFEFPSDWVTPGQCVLDGNEWPAGLNGLTFFDCIAPQDCTAFRDVGPLFHARVTLEYMYQQGTAPFSFGLAAAGTWAGNWTDVAMITVLDGYYYYNGTRVDPNQLRVYCQDTITIDFDYFRNTVTFTINAHDYTYSLQNHVIPTQFRVDLPGTHDEYPYQQTELAIYSVQITTKTGRYEWTVRDAQLSGYSLTSPGGQILVPKAWVEYMSKAHEALAIYTNPAELFPCLTNIHAAPSWPEIPDVMPGEVLSGSLNFTYEGTDNPTVAYTLTPPDGWGISSSGGTSSLLSITAIPFNLTVPVDAPAGVFYLTFNETLADGSLKAGNTTFACTLPIRIYQNSSWSLYVDELPGVMKPGSVYGWANLFNSGTQPQQLLVTGDGVPADWLTADGFAPVMVWDFAAPTCDWNFTGGTSAIVGGALVLQSSAGERVSANASLAADLHPGDRVHVIYVNDGAVDPVLDAWDSFALSGSGLQDRTFVIDAFETLGCLNLSADVSASTSFRVTHLSIDRALTRYSPLSQFVFGGLTADIADWGWDASFGSGESTVWLQAPVTNASYVDSSETDTNFNENGMLRAINWPLYEQIAYYEVPLVEDVIGPVGYQDFGSAQRYLATWGIFEDGSDDFFKVYGCEVFDESNLTYNARPIGEMWPISNLSHRFFNEEWSPNPNIASYAWDLSASDDQFILVNCSQGDHTLIVYDDESAEYGGKGRPYAAVRVPKVGINFDSLVVQSDTSETFEISHDLAEGGQPVSLAAGDEVWVNFASIVSSQVTLTLTNANPAGDDLVFVLGTGNRQTQGFVLKNFVIPAAGNYTALKISSTLAPAENFSLLFAGVYKYQPNGIPFAEMNIGGFYADTIKPADFTTSVPSVLSEGMGHRDVLALQDNATISNNASYSFAGQAQGRLDFCVYAPGTNASLAINLTAAGGNGILLNITNYTLQCSNLSQVATPASIYGGWHLFSVGWDCSRHNYTVWYFNQTVYQANYTSGEGILNLTGSAITGIQLNTTVINNTYLVDGVYLDTVCHAPTNESLVELNYTGAGYFLTMQPGEEWTLYVAPGTPGTFIGSHLAIYDSGHLVGLLHQNVAVNYPPTVTHWEPYSYISGLEDTKQINWTITDGGYVLSNATWEVLRNGTQIASDSWTASPTQVIVPTANQVPGLYIFELWVDDGYTGSLMLDSTTVYVLDAPPEATPCANYSYSTFEEYDRYAYWNVTHVGELGPSACWEVRVGTEVVNSGPWVASGDLAYVWTGNQAPGSYTYALYADTGYSGLQHVDADINVTAYDAALPASNSPPDCSFWTGRENTTIAWAIADTGIMTGAGRYEVFRNDTTPFKVLSGDFTYNGQWVSYTVEDLPPRAYNFSLYVTDGMSGMIWVDNVTVWANNTVPTATHVDDFACFAYLESDAQFAWTIMDLGAIHPSKAKIQVRVNGSAVFTVDFNASPQTVVVPTCTAWIGINNYTLWVDDGYTAYLMLDEVLVTADNPVPWVDSPADYSYFDNDGSKNITWTITNPHGVSGGAWVALCNGTQVASGTWCEIGDTVTIYTNGSAPGACSYTLEVFDGYTILQDVDTVQVSVYDDDTEGPTIAPYYSGSGTDGAPGYWVIPAASDPAGIYNYTIFNDGAYAGEGPGSYALSNLLGLHTCTVVVRDNDTDWGAADRAAATITINATLVDDDTTPPTIYAPQLSHYGYLFTTVLVRISDASGLQISLVKFGPNWTSWKTMVLSSGDSYDGYWTYQVPGYYTTCHIQAYDNDTDRGSYDRSLAYL